MHACMYANLIPLFADFGSRTVCRRQCEKYERGSGCSAACSGSNCCCNLCSPGLGPAAIIGKELPEV